MTDRFDVDVTYFGDDDPHAPDDRPSRHDPELYEDVTREVAGRDLQVGDDLVSFDGTTVRVTRLEPYVPSSTPEAHALAAHMGPARVAYIAGYAEPWETIIDTQPVRIAC